MEAVNQNSGGADDTAQTVKCVICRETVAASELNPTSRLCRLCANELAEFGWRTVYDRDQNIGEIPANLRAAYGL